MSRSRSVKLRVEQLDQRVMPDAVPVGYIIGPFAPGYYPTSYQLNPSMTLPDLQGITRPDFNTFDAINQYAQHWVDEANPLQDALPADLMPADPSSISGPTQFPDLYVDQPGDSAWLQQLYARLNQEMDQGVTAPIQEIDTSPFLGYLDATGLHGWALTAMRLATRDCMSNMYNWAINSRDRELERAMLFAEYRDNARAAGQDQLAADCDMSVTYHQGMAVGYAVQADRCRQSRDVPLTQMLAEVNQQWAATLRMVDLTRNLAANARSAWVNNRLSSAQFEVAEGNAVAWGDFGLELQARMNSIQQNYNPVTGGGGSWGP